MLMLIGSAFSITIQNERRHHQPEGMSSSSNFSSSSSSSFSDNNGKHQASASETVCSNGICKQVICKDGKCENAHNLSPSEQNQNMKMPEIRVPDMNMGSHFGQSMFSDDFMKPMKGFGNMSSFGDMGFPSFKLPKIPSFNDMENGFVGFGHHMRD
jgi:hypothetical protein